MYKITSKTIFLLTMIRYLIYLMDKEKSVGKRFPMQKNDEIKTYFKEEKE